MVVITKEIIDKKNANHRQAFGTLRFGNQRLLATHGRDSRSDGARKAWLFPSKASRATPGYVSFRTSRFRELGVEQDHAGGPFLVFCEGWVSSVIKMKVPALSLQRTERQGRGTLADFFGSATPHTSA